MRRKWAVFCLFICLTLLSGCFFEGGPDLLVLPDPPLEQVELQKVIDELLAQGWSYSAVGGGINRGSVQYTDIYNDEAKEVLLFLKKAPSTQRISVLVKNGSSYFEKSVILEEGTSVEGVYYPDFDGDGTREMVVCWRLAENDILGITAYSLLGSTPREILSTNGTGYTVEDINLDGLRDLLVIKNDPTGEQAAASLYAYKENEIKEISAVPLSGGVAKPKSLVYGKFNDATSMVSILGETEKHGYVLDVLCFSNGRLLNVTYDNKLMYSEVTSDNPGIQAADLMRDGVLEYPVVEQIEQTRLTPESQLTNTAAYVSWYSCNNYGLPYPSYVSYDWLQEGFRMLLPSSLQGKYRVSKKMTLLKDMWADMFEFKYVNAPEAPAFLIIYRMESDDYQKISLSEEYELLASKTGVSYIAYLNRESKEELGVELRNDQLSRYFSFFDIPIEEAKLN